jgi:hypothetical protein
MTTAEAAIIIASFSLSWACALIMVPRYVCSLFRYRLWRVRDHLQDCIWDGKLPELPVVTDLLEIIEVMIQHSEGVCLSRYLAFRMAGGIGRTPVPFDLSGLSSEERERFINILATLYYYVMFKAIAGSSVGAFFLPLLMAWFKWRKALVARPLAEPQTEFRRVQEFRVSVANRGSGAAREPLAASVG